MRCCPVHVPAHDPPPDPLRGTGGSLGLRKSTPGRKALHREQKGVEGQRLWSRRALGRGWGWGEADGG